MDLIFLGPGQVVFRYFHAQFLHIIFLITIMFEFHQFYSDRSAYFYFQQHHLSVFPHFHGFTCFSDDHSTCSLSTPVISPLPSFFSLSSFCLHAVQIPSTLSACQNTPYVYSCKRCHASPCSPFLHEFLIVCRGM